MTAGPVHVHDRYRLGRAIGAGGMGRVWQARDEILDRDVALKEILLPDELVDADLSLRRHMLREARAAARLSHPNVAQIYDAFEADGRAWIVMEYVPSRSLQEVLDSGGPLPPARAAEIGLAVLAALTTAHAAGVRHRDVKPANVLLADDGRVVLTDFGVASVEGESVNTSSGLVIGSPRYMAPERVRDGESTPAGDLWSLGATLYAAVEGHAPYMRDSVMETITAIASEEPAPTTRAGALRPVLDGLLRKSPGERIDAAETARLLRVAADSADTAVVPPASRPSAQPATPGRETTPRRETPSPAASPPARETPPPAASPPPRETPSPAASPPARETPPPAASPPARETPPPAAPTSENKPPAASPGETKPAAPPPTESKPPAVPPHHIGPGPRSRRSRVILAVVVALLLLAGGGIAWMSLRHDAGDTVADPPGASAPALPSGDAASSAPASSPAGASETGGASGSGSASASPSRAPVTESTAASGGGNPRPPLPAGWRDYRDPTGFSVYVPVGWRQSKEKGIVYFRGDGRVLGIDQTDTPQWNPVADWRGKADYRVARGDFPGYHEIHIQPVNYFLKAADWEYTFDRSGVRQHVNNRGLITSRHQAYGIYWQTTDAAWSAAQPDLRLVFASFRPRPEG
ncbi:protein kinase domain-containing protein [Actinoplanes sp. CA-030573]|uniref:serine/threonine-protein kinase n=1 Tax=Actinoplanes sp. CA-030573 TaxID=3239898 RepID=UPI003D8F500F